MADGTIQEVEVPYDIPKSWEWVRLGTIISAKGGKRIPKGYNLQEEDNGHPYLRVTDMKNGTIVPNSIKYAPDTVYEKIKNYTISSNDIYITIAGTIGDIGVVPKKFNNALLTENALKLMLTSSVNKMFLVYLLNSQLVQQQFKEVYNQVAQPKLSIRSTNSTLIPLPPLAEQKRIVAQIEKALAKVDEYAESYNKLQQLDKEFPDKLKKSILQYAMQGKLVAQSPDDEPVEVLLEKIKAEKQKLFEEGKLKKKDLAEMVVEKGDDNSPYKEVPYSIPKSWKWVKLNDITSYIQRGKSPKYSTVPKYPVIAQKCNQWSGFSIELAKFVSPDTVDSYQEERLLKDGDLMWNSTGLGTLGRLAIYSEVKNPYGWAVADSHVTIIRLLLKFIDYHFIYHFLASPIVQNVIEEQASGSTKQKELATTTVKNYLIPLPPLTEQQRIVSKISQVFSVIESLV